MDYVVDLVLKPVFEYAGGIAWFILLAAAWALLSYLFEKLIDSRVGTPILKLYKASQKWPDWLRESLPFVWHIGYTVILFWFLLSL